MTETLIQPATLVELLRYRATAQPEGHAYTFLIDGKKETPPLTYSELDRQARAIPPICKNTKLKENGPCYSILKV